MDKLTSPVPDPVPDPDSLSVQDVVEAGKTAGKLVGNAVSAAQKIDVSDGLEAEELVDAALEVTKDISPLSRKETSLLRKLLVPILTAIIAAVAGGGFGAWQASVAKAEALKEAEERAAEIVQEAKEQKAQDEVPEPQPNGKF